MADDNDKQFDATPQRREKAREEGQVPFSQDLGSAALLVAGIALLLSYGGGILSEVTHFMRVQLGDVGTLVVSKSVLTLQWQQIMGKIATAMFPIFGFLFLAAVASSLFQTGFLFIPSKVKPDIGNLSLFKGVQRIVSLQGVMKLGFGLFKILIVSAVAAAVLWTKWEDVLNSGELETAQLGLFILRIVLHTALWIACALFLLAIFDYAFQFWKHEKDLKMSHQEIRDEMKDQQGDPQMIAKRKQIQRQMVMDRVGEAVPKADVIVTNPTELAIAIQYDPATMAAPVVTAKGAGLIAQRIRRLALENNIPILERKPLARALFKEVEVGDPVPDERYAAVAEILAYVYQLKGKDIPAPPPGAAA